MKQHLLSSTPYSTLYSRFQTWLLHQAELDYVPLTCETYLRIIRTFLHYLEAYSVLRLQDVTFDSLHMFIQFKPDQTPYKPSSQLARQAALSLFLSWVFNQRLCPENVWLRYRKARVKVKHAKLPALSHSTPELVLLTDEEQQQLSRQLTSAATFVEKRTAAIVSLILATGLYREEVCQLKLQQVNLAKGLLTIEDRAKARTIKIDLFICEKALNNWLKAREEMLKNNTCDWLFFTERLTALRVNMLPLYIKPMLETAGISSEKANADCLRQTAIYRWIAQGISLEKVQAQFGFKQIASLKRYCL